MSTQCIWFFGKLMHRRALSYILSVIHMNVVNHINILTQENLNSMGPQKWLYNFIHSTFLLYVN